MPSASPRRCASVGLKAAAVSGRTPPRELANTLAAYERGEINVLVNAQLLAEGWNAPRATVCMHLAPTASKRVYQQRIGRIMRLHRRKEAGVVVDFAEADRAALRPHGHGALAARRRHLPPGRARHPALAAPPAALAAAREAARARGRLARARHGRPAERREIILRDWKQIAIDRLPVDEQGMWAENAGRRVGQKDLQKLAKVLTSVSEETRMLFFATCAAENKHRQLRLIALGDLAQNRPTANVFERAVRLVEAAPTWRLDRAQGSRTLLLALGDRRVEASDHQIVAWAWRLARASRDAQFRHLTSAHESGRDVARALAGKSGDDVMRAAKGIAAMALNSPLDLGAALLAVVQTTDLGASRILEDARDRLSGDAAGLAAALGANIPLPRAPRRPQPAKRPAQRPAREAAVVDAEPNETAEGTAAPEQGAEGEPKKRKRRRRRRRGGGQGAGAAPARRRRRAGRRVAAAGGRSRPSSGAPAPPTVRSARAGRSRHRSPSRGRTVGEAPVGAAVVADKPKRTAAPEGGRARGVRRRRGRAAAARRVRGRGGAPSSRGARGGRRPSPPSDLRPGPARPGWDGLPRPRRRAGRARGDRGAPGARRPASRSSPTTRSARAPTTSARLGAFGITARAGRRS